MSIRDPFSLTYDAIWEMLETASFRQLIKVGNRIKFSAAGGYRDPELLANLGEDRPVVGVLNTGMTFGSEKSSSESFATIQYQIVLVCGDARLDKEFYPCIWEIVVACLGWWDRLRVLQYLGRLFIHMAEPTILSSTYVDQKGIKGWVGRLSYEVQMNFQTATIR